MNRLLKLVMLACLVCRFVPLESASDASSEEERSTHEVDTRPCR